MAIKVCMWGQSQKERLKLGSAVTSRYAAVSDMQGFGTEGALQPSWWDSYFLVQPDSSSICFSTTPQGLLLAAKGPFSTMNMGLEVRLQQNAHSFVRGAVTCRFINPIISPRCRLSSHLQGREAPETKQCVGGCRVSSSPSPQPSPELEAQIPTVRAEGRHIKPGNKAAVKASGPGAALRAFLLLGRSLFLGLAEGGQVVIKEILRWTQLALSLIQTKQEAPKLGPDSVLEGRVDEKSEGQARAACLTSPWGLLSPQDCPGCVKTRLPAAVTEKD